MNYTIIGNDIIIEGVLTESTDDNKVYYIAAAPPDYRQSFTGSGLPFHSEEQAYDNTPNIGQQYLLNNKYSIKIKKPNAYHNSLDGVIVKPHVIIYFYKNKEKKEIKLDIPDRIPFRDIRYHGGEKTYRNNVDFYYNPNLPIRTQEQILIDSQYPAIDMMPANFWGYKPPL